MPAIRTGADRVRPSGWWFLLIPMVLLAGLGAGLVSGIDEFRRITSSFRPLGVDGTGTVRLRQGDVATVWAVWEDGRSGDAVSRPPARVQVAGPAGAAIPFEPARGGWTTWSFGSSAGIDLGTFTAPADGDYQVRVTFGSGAGTVPAPVAAVGQLDLSASVSRVLRPIGLSLAAALAVLVVLLALRGRSRGGAAHRGAGPAVERDAPPPPSSGPITFS